MNIQDGVLQKFFYGIYNDKQAEQPNNNKYNFERLLINNDYDYSDTGRDSNKGLLSVTAIISNYIYITNKLGINQATVVRNAYQQLNSGSPRSANFSILLGYMDALNSGEMNYYDVPSTNKMREWLNKYIGVSRSGGAPTANNDTFDVNMENQSPQQVQQPETQDLSVRALKLSADVCMQNNLSLEQLIDVQTKLLEQLNVTNSVGGRALRYAADIALRENLSADDMIKFQNKALESMGVM
jgi:hypothetical protein